MRMLRLADGRAEASERLEMLTVRPADEVLAAWDAAPAVMLAAEDLDGMATALYTVGGPVRMDACSTRTWRRRAPAGRGRPDRRPGTGAPADPKGTAQDDGAALSVALEALADLGVVELGADEVGAEEPGGALTVTLSPLGVWGVHRRLRAQGWYVPVVGGGARGDAPPCWLRWPAATWKTAKRDRRLAGGPDTAAGRGRADRGREPRHARAARRRVRRAGPHRQGRRRPVREALDDPVLRAHAAVWLVEHGEDAELGREDRAWLLVDLGAGLLEEADPKDVVAELLPDVPPDTQAELVAGLWRVQHPGVTDLLTALSDHHPDPGVARAARKAAFKARSVAAARTRKVHRLTTGGPPRRPVRAWTGKTVCRQRQADSHLRRPGLRTRPTRCGTSTPNCAGWSRTSPTR